MRAARSDSAGLALIALVAANITLAFGPWFVRLADVGPVAIGFWRLALAVPFLTFLVFAGRRGGSGPTAFGLTRPLLVALAFSGFFFAADLAAWHAGILHTKLANATLFGNCSAFLFAAYAFIAARALPSRIQALAIALALGGTLLLIGRSYELSAQYLKGDLLALLAGFFYALYLIIVDRARSDLPPMLVLALASLAGALPLLLVALLLGEAVWPQQWAPLLGIAIGSQVIGQGLLVYAMGHLPPLVVGIGLLTQPAIAAIIGWLAYREAFTPLDALGALLICVALVLIRLPERLAQGVPAAHKG